jgi:hypothetical protein
VTATSAGGTASATSPQSAAVTSPGPCSSSTPNSPGGPDPWGGCFPGPTNTGVPAGTTLSTYTGPCTITTDNTVIGSQTINCAPLEISANGVQITKSRINGYIDVGNGTYPNPDYLTITDSEVNTPTDGGAASNGISSLGKSNFTAIRDNFHGGIRSVWCEYSCTEKDSYTHGQLNDQTYAAHESATRPGQNSTITHNTLFCEAHTYPPPNGGGCSADMTGYPDFAAMGPWAISNNLFVATEGGTCAYGGGTPNKPFSGQEHGIVFKNNVFQKNPGSQHGTSCGYWFSIADFNANAPGDQWINNTFSDGSVMPDNG